MHGLIAFALSVPLFVMSLFGGSTGGSLFASAATAGYGGEKVTICHLAGKHYQTLTVSATALKGFSQQSGNIIPAPPDGCPTS